MGSSASVLCCTAKASLVRSAQCGAPQNSPCRITPAVISQAAPERMDRLPDRPRALLPRCSPVAPPDIWAAAATPPTSGAWPGACGCGEGRQPRAPPDARPAHSRSGATYSSRLTRAAGLSAPPWPASCAWQPPPADSRPPGRPCSRPGNRAWVRREAHAAQWPNQGPLQRALRRNRRTQGARAAACADRRAPAPRAAHFGTHGRMGAGGGARTAGRPPRRARRRPARARCPPPWT